MRIYSSKLAYNAISPDSDANPITLTKSMDAGKISVVTTRLVGAFFTNLAEGETNSLTIDGTAVMKFACFMIFTEASCFFCCILVNF